MFRALFHFTALQLCKDDERFKFLCRWASVQCNSIVHLQAPWQNAHYTAAGLKGWFVILILRCNLFQMILILKLLMIYQKTLITEFQQISEDWTKIHQFCAPKPGVSHCAAPHTGIECFWLMFTDKLLNIILVPSHHYYQTTHSKTGRQIWQDISTDELYNFTALIILMVYDYWDAIKDYWSTKPTNYNVLHSSQKW